MSKQKGGGWQDTYRYLPGIEHAYAVVTDDSAQTMGNEDAGAGLLLQERVDIAHQFGLGVCIQSGCLDKASVRPTCYGDADVPLHRRTEWEDL